MFHEEVYWGKRVNENSREFGMKIISREPEETFYKTLGFSSTIDGDKARRFYNQFSSIGHLEIIGSKHWVIDGKDDFKRILMTDYGLTERMAKAAIVFYRMVDLEGKSVDWAINEIKL